MGIVTGSKDKYFQGINYAILIVFAIICIIPVTWLIYTSFKPRMLTFVSPPVWIRFTPTLENYRRLIQERNLLKPLFNSVVIVVISTTITIFVGSFASYVFSRYKKGWIRPTLFIILITNMIPPVVVILPLFLLARRLNLYDTRIMMIIVYTALSLAFAIWMLRSFFLEIPAEIEESALIDGCNKLGVLFRIIFPLTAPAIASTAILVFIFNWNEFIIALVITSRNAFTLPILANSLISAKGVMWGQIAAASTFITVPEIIFIMFAQKHIVRGLTMGAVKG